MTRIVDGPATNHSIAQWLRGTHIYDLVALRSGGKNMLGELIKYVMPSHSKEEPKVVVKGNLSQEAQADRDAFFKYRSENPTTEKLTPLQKRMQSGRG
jgi:hypothetical protein